MARMKDVADRCGVAESTVSHVLNNTRYVSPQNQGSRPRRDARAELSRQRARKEASPRRERFPRGLIISDIENPFFPGLIKAFESAALRHGFDVLLSTTNYEPLRTEKAFRKMVENKAPGVAVLTSGVDPALARLLESNGVASIFLDAGSVGPKRSNVRLNYAKGANEAVHYLYNLGHWDFALIAGPQNRHSHVAYREAIAAALQETDLQPQVLDGSNDVEGGARAVQQLLTGRQFPTAILCSNDLTAIGALRALFRAGIRVPDDVALVGADDIPFAELTRPPLSTVRIPREKLGELACQVLQEMLIEKQQGSDRLLDTELVIRESTAGAPARPMEGYSSVDSNTTGNGRRKKFVFTAQ
jgi:DNA-binding LacI/PurR family transcriptional regulator